MARQHHDGTKTLNEISAVCAERVSQMTKTYDDIEDVTHLLEEKERDLELAARIGQTLLSKNKDLSSRLESLEEQLSAATDRINQLRHELSQKDELLRCYSEDLEHESGQELEYSYKSGSMLASTSFLENKVRLLEDENLTLRLESAQLRADADRYEEKEKKKLDECDQRLAEMNLQVESLNDELHQKSEENRHQKEELNSLQPQLNELKKKVKKLSSENMDMHEKMTSSAETQAALTKQLGNMQDKCDILSEMLQEAQDELKQLRRKLRLRSGGQHSAYAESTDSLASELETSLQQELAQSIGRVENWNVFESSSSKPVGNKGTSATRMPLAPANRWDGDSQGLSAQFSDIDSMTSDACSVDVDSLYESNSELGQPGIPGSNDLECALKRLGLMKTNEKTDRSFEVEEEERRKKKLQSDLTDGMSQKSQDLPIFRSRKDSMSSCWSSAALSVTSQHFKLPEKLLIVKPLEGSMTLRQWQHLATPHLGRIFDERDGVQIKGEKKQDLLAGVCSLGDLSEDGVTVQDASSSKEHFNVISSSTLVSGTHTEISTASGNSGIQISNPIRGTQSPQKPWQHKQPLDHIPNSYGTPVGLAALLQGSGNVQVSPFRTTTSSPGLSKSSASPSSSDLNQTFHSARSFESQPLLSSTPKNTMVSNSFNEAVIKYEEKRTVTESKLENISDTSAHDSTGKSFLQQLKSTGYSLYDLWKGGGKTGQSEVASDAATAFHDSMPATAESVLPRGEDIGILGALSNYRRRGLF